MVHVTRLFWAAVLVAAVLLLVDTTMNISRYGLVGERPPVPMSQALLRVAMGGAAAIFAYMRRDALGRITGLSFVAAAASTALYGFGMRSPALSAFRLLSHFGAYALAVTLALVSLAQLFRRRPAAG